MFIKRIAQIAVLFLLIFSSCNKKPDEQIIPKDTFKEIIKELYLADAIISGKGYEGHNIKDSVPAYYTYILNKHAVTRASFDYTYSYYTGRMDELIAIYDKILIELQAMAPIKMSEKSMYKIFDLILEESLIKANPAKWIGMEGRLLWREIELIRVINKDSLKRVQFKEKIKVPCLIMLQSEIFVEKEDSSKNLRMSIQINYKDSTFEKIDKPIKKNNNWITYQLFATTDSTKTPKNVECQIIDADTLIGPKHVMVRNIFLKLYTFDKDTLQLKIKTPDIRKIR
jgi:hypothetical protein